MIIQHKNLAISPFTYSQYMAYLDSENATYYLMNHNTIERQRVVSIFSSMTWISGTLLGIFLCIYNLCAVLFVFEKPFRYVMLFK
jgi:hypothetical protein